VVSTYLHEPTGYKGLDIVEYVIRSGEARLATAGDVEAMDHRCERWQADHR